MAINVKEYLDYPGLKKYDEEIKAWFKQNQDVSVQEIQQEIDALAELVGDESVAQRVQEAIAAIIDGAPETFDTLKEIAQWIEEHGETAAALIETVAAQGQAIVNLDHKIDEVYDAFKPISDTYIEALFLEPVSYNSNKTVSEQIAALGENEKLVIDASQNSTISEDIAIDSDCVIEAEGVEFTGRITVTEGTNAAVIGATFSGEVVVQ